jgi:hypothetical protein
MSDDRIRITVDDVARISDVPPPGHASAGVNTPFTGAPNVISSGSKFFSPMLVLACIVVGIVLVTLMAALAFSDHGETMESWIQNQRKVYDAELLTSSEPKKMIENIHPFVTFSSANVKFIRATTVDGTQKSGKDGANISELEVVVTYQWEGLVEKNGFTYVQYVFNMQNRKLKSTKYLATNAPVNLDNIDWFKLGYMLAPILFGGN